MLKENIKNTFAVFRTKLIPTKQPRSQGIFTFSQEEGAKDTIFHAFLLSKSEDGLGSRLQKGNIHPVN